MTMAHVRLDAAHKLDGTTSDTKIHRLGGNETKIVSDVSLISPVRPDTRVPQDAHQARERVWAIDGLRSENEVVRSTTARRTLEIEGIPRTRKEAEMESVRVEGCFEGVEELGGEVYFRVWVILG